MVQVSYPGVYIEEFAPGAPIQGVGTSTAAFLGPLANGPLRVPTKVASWDEFKRAFDPDPLDGFYLWYAVRGFFENGGTLCYVTRVSNAAFDAVVLDDQASPNARHTVRVGARAPGANSKITVSTADSAAVNAKAFRPTGTMTAASGSTVAMTDAAEAAQFRPGDRLTWTGTAEPQPVYVLRVEGSTIRLQDALAGVYGGGTLRLDDLRPGDRTVRLNDQAAALGTGSFIELSQGATKDRASVARVDVERISAALTTYRVQLAAPGLSQTFDLSAGDVGVVSFEFTLTVQEGANPPQVYPDLGMDPNHPRFFASVVNNDPNGVVFVEAAEPPNITPPPDNRPLVAANVALAGGQDDDPTTLGPTDYSDALALLEPLRDVNQVAIPDRTDQAVQLALIDHCYRLHDRFAILDSRRGDPPFGLPSVELQAAGVDEPHGFAALYYPWLVVPAAKGSGLVTVPPSGHMAGLYARTDNGRGVHKAPAGEEATVAWGARTTSSDTNWQYINVRRLFLYLEGSIREGIRWGVFEPNNLSLWQKLKRTINEFLTRVWRDGALFGAKASDAFYVRIDDALNPFSEQALGRLNIEIGLRPSYPAEFIIVRIGIWPGGADVSEG